MGFTQLMLAFVNMMFSATPLAMDAHGCYIMEAHFAFSIPDATLQNATQQLGQLYTHMSFELVLNSIEDRACKAYIHCISGGCTGLDCPPIDYFNLPPQCGPPGVISPCLLPPEMRGRGSVNVIRAKFCE